MSEPDHRPRPAPSRRAALGALGAFGTAALAGCGGGEAVEDNSATATIESELETVLSATTASCVVTASAPSGPHPLLSVLDHRAIVRQDITEGKIGTPLALTLKLVDYDNGCAPLVGAAVYVWHCDANGEYSGYSSTANGAHSGQTFLRGVQLSNHAGKVSFTTIFPGWHLPRLTHLHLQVFVAGTTLSSHAVAAASTQLRFPDVVTSAVYANLALYPQGQNPVGVAADPVFGQGSTTQTLVVSGSVADGLAAGLVIGLSAGTGASDDAASPPLLRNMT